MSSNGPELCVGDTVSGYLLEKDFFFKEIHSRVYVFRHVATGARHLHIENQDLENCFSVAFKTIPRDSTGVAHILEHIILCGSEKYPVRDPFFSMIKRSLSSFMNALTASDWTMYPFATPNAKDFNNLMAVYLDAVFFPILSELSFKQEGHRLEVAPAGSGSDARSGDFQLTYQGVVYNEMKGAMSSPDQVMSRALLRVLYPDTTYSNNSGGDPAEIPTLTHHQLKAFHQRHYHPSNAFFFTYGHLPLTDHLAFINDQVLSRYSAIDPDTDVPSQPRWRQPRTAVETYPLAQNEDPSRKYQACVGWLVSEVGNTFDVFSLIVLEQILLGNAASPLRRALMESGLGSSLSDGTGLEADLRDVLFACGLKDIGPEDTPTVETIVIDTLIEMTRQGIDRELVDSAIHQIEFNRKEVSSTPYPYGIRLLLTIAGSWLHGTPPEEIFQIDPLIERLYREMAAGPFWENLIQTVFLNNPHRATLTLAPDHDLAERQSNRESTELARLKQALSEADIDKIQADSRTLEKLQAEPEDLTVLPTLALSDIAPDLPVIPENRLDEAIFCYPQPTSGIFYYSAVAGTGLLPAALLPLVPFFCFALPKMGTRRRNYLDMARYIDLHTGGLGVSAQVHTAFRENAPVLPYLSLFAKCLDRKQEYLFEIIEDFIRRYDFSDLDRLKQLLVEYRASMESTIVSGGHHYGILLASRCFSPACALSETWHGIHQLKYLKTLTADLDKRSLTDISEQLTAMADTLLCRENIITGLTGEEEPLSKAVDFTRGLTAALKHTDGQNGFDAGNVSVENGRPIEGWFTSTSVSFVASVFRTVRLGHEDAPTLAVISKLLRSSFLHREIREKGGAYGGFSLYNMEDGRFCFASYRDPHIGNTLAVYRRAVDYLQSGDYSDENIKESILQVCSDIDKPNTPAERGLRAFTRRITALSDEQRKKFKQGVTSVTREKVLKASAKHFPKNPQAYATAVISSETLLQEANRKLDPPLSLYAI